MMPPEYQRSNSRSANFNIIPSDFLQVAPSQRRRTFSAESEGNLLENLVTFNDPNPLIPQTILFQILEHMYATVFAKLPSDEVKQNILIELWKLIPQEVILQIKPLKQWSKKCVCRAFKLAEESSAGVCSLAIHTIFNFKKEPVIIEVALLFTERNFPEIAHVSRAAYRMLDNPQSSIPERQWLRPYARQDIKTERETQKYSALLRKKRLLVTVLICIIIASVSCYGTAVIYGQKPSQQKNLEAPRSNSFDNSSSENQEVETKRSAKLATEDTAPYNVSVTSYEEYENALFRLLPDRKINLVLSLEHDSKWPADFTTGNTHMIQQLQIIPGPNITKLLFILNVANHAETVIISYRNASYCQTVFNEQTSIYNSVVLPQVHRLVLEKFPECPGFYNIVSSTLVLGSLHSFQAINGTFTSRNTQFLKNLISNSRDTLEALEFPGCRWYALMFDNHFGTYPRVELLKLDFRGDENIIHLGENIHSIFPNLENFHSVGGFVDLDQLLNLSGCTSLLCIKIGIHTSNGSKVLNILSLPRYFRQLRSLDVSVNFVGFDKAKDCVMIGFDEVRNYLADFRYRTNCHLLKNS